MYGSNCCFLTCIQISQGAGNVVWYFHLLKNFPQFLIIYTVKGFSVVNEAKIDVFLGFLCFFCDPTDVGNLISGSSAFSKPRFYIWKYLVHILLKSSLKNFEHYLLACEMSAIVHLNIFWHCSSLGLEWNWLFPVLWQLLSFPNLLAYWVQHFHRIIF